MALSFAGRVAVVTGAGNGLGKTYALLLASRGAKVVVNDLGGSSTGSGSSARPADDVVAEIRAAGGTAVADYNNVIEGDKIIKTAIDNFGRIDILINNAGILRDGSFQKMSDADWDLIYKVHMLGSFKTTRAAWNYMRDQGYGRIIMVSSAAGLYGNFGQTNYGAMKMALVGFAKSLSVEGSKKNVLVNAIAPIAGSRLTATVLPEDMVDALKPEYVAPVVAYLCHENCKESGSVFELGAGWVSKLRWQRSKGVCFPLNSSYTPEVVRDNWDAITAFDEDAQYPSSPQDAFGCIMPNLATARSGAPAKAAGGAGGAAAPAAAPASPVTALFESMAAAVAANGPAFVKQVNAVIVFNVTSPDESWVVDLKNGTGSVKRGTNDKADMTLTIKADDFVALADGKLNPQAAFMQGKMKVKGNMGVAMKLGTVIKAAAGQGKSKL